MTGVQSARARLHRADLVVGECARRAVFLVMHTVNATVNAPPNPHIGFRVFFPVTAPALLAVSSSGILARRIVDPSSDLGERFLREVARHDPTLALAVARVNR